MKNLGRLLTFVLLAATLSWPQSQINSFQILRMGKQSTAPANPPINASYVYFDGTNMVCVTSAGASCLASSGGSGTVTSVGLAGTSNQITVTGSTPITGSGSWTLSLPSSLVLPNGATATTQSVGDNSTKVATTAYVAANAGGGTGTVGQTAIYTATNTLGAYLAAGPDVPPVSPNAMDDEFNGSSLSVIWTGANLGSSTFTETKGMGSLTGFGTNNSFLMKNYLQSVPGATPWTVTAKVNFQTFTEGCNKWGGLILSDGTKFELFGIGIPNNSTIELLQEQAATVSSNTATNALKAAVTNNIYPFGGWIYEQIQDDGTNLNFSFSFDGVNFLQARTELRGSFLSTAPTKVGWGGDASQTACAQTLAIDWFRRTQ